MSNGLGGVIVLLLASALVVAGCDGEDGQPSLEDIEQATYRTESLPAGEATLESG